MSTFQLTPTEIRCRDSLVAQLDDLASQIEDHNGIVEQALDERQLVVDGYNDKLELAKGFFFNVAYRLKAEGHDLEPWQFSIEPIVNQVPWFDSARHGDVFEDFAQLVVEPETEDA